MTRPWIEFLFAQQLSWEKGLYGGARDDVDVKTLSIDANAGDSSVIIRYPKGWSRNNVYSLDAEEEFFILSGSIEINGVIYSQDCYANLPRGYKRNNSRSEDGCVALTFFDSEPSVSSDLSKHNREEGTLIEYVNTLDMKWDSSTSDPSLAWMGNRRKVLKWDKKYNQKTTFLFSTPPHIYPDDWKCPILTHPCVEESFVLSGEFIGPQGKMTKGAYFWRPEGKPHGPFGTREGGFSLIRFKYGKHVNIWGDEEIPYTFDFPYKPILPKQIEYLGKSAYKGSDNF